MNTDRVCDNRSRFSVRAMELEDRHGREVLVVIAKATFRVPWVGEVERMWGPVRIEDVAVSSRRWSSLVSASDVTDHKPGTDVAMVGTAHPPPGVAVTEQDVRVRLETGTRTLMKTVRVYGERVFREQGRGVVPGPPAPLGPTPLLWELAYGGVDESEPGSPLIEPRNPAGVGVARVARTLVGLPAPRLLDPGAPFGAPACFAPIPAHWSPRAERFGTVDARWQRERAPVRPVDHDPRHACVGPDELWCEVPLRGGEPVEVLGVTPDGALRFLVPRVSPRFFAVVDGEASRRETHLDTLLIDADARRIELVFRASVPIPRKAERIEVVHVYEEESVA